MAQKIDAKRSMLAIFLGMIIASSLTWWAGLKLKSPTQVAADARPPSASPITAPVEYRPLSNTLVVRGEITAPREVGVEFHGVESNGLPLVTNAPIKKGAIVREGSIAIEVAQRPVFLLEGRSPMFRDLSVGLEGRDVRQLRDSLQRLGYASSDRPGYFGKSTALAVENFYRSKGYKADSNSPSPATQNDDRETKDQSKRRSTTLRNSIHAGTGEIIFLQKLPARVTKISFKVGQKADGEIMKMASKGLTVQAGVTSQEAGQMKEGDNASISLEDSRKSFKGRVERIFAAKKKDSVTQSIVQISTYEKLPFSLLGEEAKISFDAADSDEATLVVPLAAVWSNADQTSYVQKVEIGGKSRRVRVWLGSSGDGFIQIQASHGTLKPGDLVIVGK